MTITFDLSGFEQLLLLPPGEVLWRIFFWYFGWLPVAIVMLRGIIDVWLRHRRVLWDAKQKHMILAIDIPRNNAQSPRAVENMFIYFAGAHNTINLIEKWWEGKFQLGFSFEIVSIGGYIQFLIRTPVSFRSLVETAVYSQYPDAEIYEVEDYVTVAPTHYPNEEYDIWGSEFIQVTDQVLPIRCYEEFEHQFGAPEVQYKDPMASLMDLMSSLQKGEQLWYQIVLIPIGEEWKAERDHFVSKMLKEKMPGTKANNLVDKIIAWMGDVSEQIYQLWGDIEDKKKKEDDPLKMMNLKPSQKTKIEAADRKVSKLGFDVSIRGIYFSRKEVMQKAKAVNGFVGFIKQFNTGDLNALKPDTKITMTSTAYMWAEQRLNSKKTKIMHAYKERSEMLGRKPWVLNVEELATIWHFPIDAVVKAPLVQRAGARRVEPPMSLPLDSEAHSSSVKREAIFDDNYEVQEDENTQELVEQNPQRQENKTPGFMDDIEEEANAAFAELEKEVAADIADDVPVRSEAPPQQSKPASPNRGEPASPPLQRGTPPPNLPFAD